MCVSMRLTIIALAIVMFASCATKAYPRLPSMAAPQGRSDRDQHDDRIECSDVASAKSPAPAEASMVVYPVPILLVPVDIAVKAAVAASRPTPDPKKVAEANQIVRDWQGNWGRAFSECLIAKGYTAK
jgi:hypothetical protein